jgi:NFU1 iron-sulfur cluster scaffold homolog, mitochondrial
MPKIAEIEFTPNPNAKRFLLKEALTFGSPKAYATLEQTEGDLLAHGLFKASSHVTNVYYVDKWLTVTQDGGAVWGDLERLLAPIIREAPAAVEIAGDPFARPRLDVSNMDEATKVLYAQVEDMFDERVRPALSMDGGGIEIVSINGKRVLVNYQGACGTCPSSLTGTLVGIENLLQTVDPEIELVAV